MLILSVEGYSKFFHIYHLDRELPVFHELDFDLKEGQFLLVSGANGIGKSTLLRCLYRSYRPTAGRAIYQSRQGPIDLARAADADIALLRREEIGFVSQFLRARPRVSALELVAEPLLASGINWEEASARARKILTDFGLKPELWNAYPTTFSGGEQQKVNLARALIRPFRLMLLDEPTASLDHNTRFSLTSRLADLKKQGVALIGVFHHPEEIQHLLDGEIHLTGIDDTALLDDLSERELYHVAK